MQPSDDTEVFRQLREGRTLFGTGWRCVDSFEEVDDDLEDDEEEEYVVMDLGTAMDSRTLQTEATYQLIGMDTPMPFLKIGEHVFQGTVAPLIGDEVILDVVRQEDDPQRPHHRPAYKTRNRVELRAVHLTLRSEQPAKAAPPPSPPKLDPSGMSGVRSFFPQRIRRKRTRDGDDDMDVDSDEEENPVNGAPGQVPATPTPAGAMARPSGLRNSFAPSYSADEGEGFFHAPMQTPGPASSAAGESAQPQTQTTGDQPQPGDQSQTQPQTGDQPEAPQTPLPPLGTHPSVAAGASRSKGHGRPRGSTSRASLPVSTMTDLADIHHAGGLGDVRLEIAEDATPELLAAVSAIRGKPSGPGTKLSRAQEERLVRGLPASGPGSRGGRGSRGRGITGGRPRGRPRGRGGFVNPAGVGLAEGFLGIVGDEEWDEEGEYGGEVGGERAEGTGSGSGRGEGTLAAEGSAAGAAGTAGGTEAGSAAARSAGEGAHGAPAVGAPAAAGPSGTTASTAEMAQPTESTAPAPAAPAPATSPLRRIDSDEELREIDE